MCSKHSLILVILLFFFQNYSEAFAFNKNSFSNSNFHLKNYEASIFSKNFPDQVGNFRLVDWVELPIWNDDLSNFLEPFLENCKVFLQPISKNLSGSVLTDFSSWRDVCFAAFSESISLKETYQMRNFLKTHFEPWALVDQDKKKVINVMTGYYEPILEGSRSRKGKFIWPIYGLPDDLLSVDLGGLYPELIGKRIRGKLKGQSVVPYDSRKEIQSSKKNIPVIVWTDNPISNFYFQIQGSGRIILVDGPEYGKIIRLSYANHNGHPYKSIGAWLSENKEMSIDQASVKNIQLWAKKNPDRLQELMDFNPSVVFFQEFEIEDFNLGPIGSYGLPLTPKRSIAVDPTFIPLGSLIFVSETSEKKYSENSFSQLVFAQDTGHAIKGIGRADLYLGFGKKAEFEANAMKKNVQMWLLWPKRGYQSK